MDIVLKREVTGVGIWLPLEEAVQFLRNPKKVLQEVETMLRAGGGVDPKTGQALGTGFPAEKSVAFLPRPGGTMDVDAGTEPRKGRGRPPGAFRRLDGSLPSRAVTGTVPCPYCGKLCKKGTGLAVHVAAKHTREVDARRDAQRDTRGAL